MRWGPVVASAVASLALIVAGFVGITVTADGREHTFGLVALDGFVGETMLILAIALTGFAVAVAVRKMPALAFIGLGAVAALSVFISRASLSSDADTVREFIGSQGSADGLDSALTSLVKGSVSAAEVGSAAALLGMAGAAALVAIGWAGFVVLDDRRPRTEEQPTGPVGSPEPSTSITDSSQLPHT